MLLETDVGLMTLSGVRTLCRVRPFHPSCCRQVGSKMYLFISNLAPNCGPREIHSWGPAHILFSLELGCEGRVPGGVIHQI